ncbi:MAG: hypothetical protein N3E37_00690 [Candidatus Micrarchaeota archaeon]|nr:hypothetical protein [Candidatus Micrarchaeota archaeon]
MNLIDESEKKFEELAKKYEEKNYVYSIIYIDMHGKDEDDVRNLLVELLTRINKEDNVIAYYGKILEPIKENDIVSTTAEVKLITKDLLSLSRICNKYNPFAIEILKPEKYVINANEAALLLLEASNQIYNYSEYIVKNSLDIDKLKKYLQEQENRKLLGKKLLEEFEKKKK